MDSNASRAGEVERKVRRDNDSLRRAQLLKTPQLVVGQTAVSTQRKRGPTAPCRCWLRNGPDDARPIAYCQAPLKARIR